MKKRNFSVIVLLLSISVIIACGEPIPIKEMALARHEISRAMLVKADKYAPELLKEAQDQLYAAHNNIADDKLKDAQKQAVSSKEKATQAFEKAVPLLAKDTIDIAGLSLQEAEEAYASELASDDYLLASEKLKSAQDLFESKKFYEAYLAAIDADAAAKNARNIAIGKKDLLKDAIDEVSTTIAESKKYGAETIIPAKVQLAEENVGAAEDSYNNLKLKEGFAAVEVAKINADEAYLAAVKKTATDTIEEASMVITDAEASAGAKNAPDTLDGAKEMLITSKSQFEASQYLQAINSAKEAKRLAGEVIASSSTVAVEPGKVDKDIEVSSETEAEEDPDFYIYKVKYYKNPPKDCLWFISRKYYKNPRLWKKIYKANKDKIKNPHLIQPGWEIKVPKLKKD